jgi:hypothetical protein
MRAAQHREQRVELQLDTLVVLSERQYAQQSLRDPA